MRGDALTERQGEVLSQIREHIRQWGVPPSRSELAQRLGLAFGSAVNYHLKALDRKGWIQLDPGRDRGIQLLREGAPVFDSDDLPAVAAGTPIIADESRVSFRVPAAFAHRIHPRADFYLVVRGDSMDQVGYRSGDIVAVDRDADPRNGDVVIARIGTEITLKCFHRKDNPTVELQPRSTSPEHRPIVLDNEDRRLPNRRRRRRRDDWTAAMKREQQRARWQTTRYGGRVERKRTEAKHGDHRH